MSYKVIIPPTAEPITLEQAKAHLNVVVPDDDALIQGMISAAREMVENKTNRALMPQVIEVSAPTFGSLTMPRIPFRSVVSLTYTDPYGADQVVDATGYFVNDYNEPPTFAPYPGTAWPGIRYQDSAVRLRYEAGYADAASVPASLKHYMLLLIGTMYENRETVQAGVSLADLNEDFMRALWHPYKVYV